MVLQMFGAGLATVQASLEVSTLVNFTKGVLIDAQLQADIWRAQAALPQQISSLRLGVRHKGGSKIRSASTAAHQICLAPTAQLVTPARLWGPWY